MTALALEIIRQRPLKTLKVGRKIAQGLLDTGADRSCTARKYWPGTWPVAHTTSTLVGLGVASNIAQSPTILT